MRSENSSDAGALRPQDHDAARLCQSDDTGGLRSPVSRHGRRALRGGFARLEGVVPPTWDAQPSAGPLPLRGQHASGTRLADGGDLRPDVGRELDRGLGFDAPMAPHSYRWWYVDGLSTDGQHGITLIAFLGSVFSPYYAWDRRFGRADPLNHCSINVALYGASGGRWAMTERGRRRVARDAASLAIGPSSVDWDGTTLTIRVDEWTAPWPSRLRGTVRVKPAAITDQAFVLDLAGRHLWRPVAPCSRWTSSTRRSDGRVRPIST